MMPALQNRFPPTPCVTLSPPIYLSWELTDFCSGTQDCCKIGIHYIHVDNVRTVPEQLGHHDVKTTEIYTHVLKRGARGVRSPFSDL
jgi:integrase